MTIVKNPSVDQYDPCNKYYKMIININVMKTKGSL